MATALETEVLQDDIAISIARVVASANKRARELGVDIPQSIISITQDSANGGWFWRVNYCPKDYVGGRGGDLVIEVEPGGGSVKQVLWGQ